MGQYLRSGGDAGIRHRHRLVRTRGWPVSRHKVSVTTVRVYFVDAPDMESAAAVGLDFAAHGARPVYSLEPMADVEVFAGQPAQVAANTEKQARIGDFA